MLVRIRSREKVGKLALYVQCCSRFGFTWNRGHLRSPRIHLLWRASVKTGMMTNVMWVDADAGRSNSLLLHHSVRMTCPACERCSRPTQTASGGPVKVRHSDDLFHFCKVKTTKQETMKSVSSPSVSATVGKKVITHVSGTTETISFCPQWDEMHL